MANNRGFWASVSFALLLRLILIFFSKKLNLGSRPEIATPLTSLRRLAEGYWLKQSSMSPYAGSMYHGSPLLLSILGPLTVQSVEVQTNHIKCRFYYCNAYSCNWSKAAAGIQSKLEITRSFETSRNFKRM